MKKKLFLQLGYVIALTGLLAACNTQQIKSNDSKHIQHNSGKPIVLKDAFAGKFMIGTALPTSAVLNPTNAKLTRLIESQFNSITPENNMKWESIQPTPNQWNFEGPDAMVDFAEKNDMFLVGHTLVWHSQAPEWIFKDNNGNVISREALLKRMEHHINTVAGRYRGRIQAWDVVNEALNEDGTLRESKWQQIIGDDYIDYAFQYAAKAAPNAKLYYNDYNLFKPEKRQGVVSLVKHLQSKGIRIDGVGMQGHYALDYPADLSQVEDSIIAYAELGVGVDITELDITVLEFPDEDNQGADVSLNIQLQERFNPYKKGLPKHVEKQLADRYRAIFAILNRHADKVDRVTMWGTHNSMSWRNNWPMNGRTDYPLLFDRKLKQQPFVATLPFAK